MEEEEEEKDVEQVVSEELLSMKCKSNEEEIYKEEE